MHPSHVGVMDAASPAGPRQRFVPVWGVTSTLASSVCVEVHLPARVHVSLSVENLPTLDAAIVATVSSTRRIRGSSTSVMIRRPRLQPEPSHPRAAADDLDQRSARPALGANRGTTHSGWPGTSHPHSRAEVGLRCFDLPTSVFYFIKERGALPERKPRSVQDGIRMCVGRRLVRLIGNKSFTGRTV